MTKTQKNIRISDLTARQLVELSETTGMSDTELISTAIDRMHGEEIRTMKTIKLGKKNDAHTYAVKVGNRYHKMSDADRKHEQPDAKICFDSGVYPGISDIDQYMCDKASGK